MSLDYADRDAHLERGEYLLEEDHGHYARDTVTLSLSLPHLIRSYLMFIMLTYVYCSLCIQHSECEPLGLYIGLYLLTTSTCPHVLSPVFFYLRYTYIQYTRYSIYPLLRHIVVRSMRYAPRLPLTYGASAMLGGILHPS